MKKEFKKIFLLMSLVVLVFGFTACGLFSKVSLEEANRKMTEELDNCNYKMNITAMGFSIDSTGTLDLKNDITYMKTSFFGISSEEYDDYGKGVKYSDENSLFSEDTEASKWVKSLIIEEDDSNNEILSFVELSDYLSDIEIEDEDNGKRYSGIITADSLDKLSLAEGEVLEDSDSIDGDIEMEFFVNSDNYIESIDITYTTDEAEMKVLVEFSEFNKAGAVVIPDEALNADFEEEDDYYSY